MRRVLDWAPYCSYGALCFAGLAYLMVRTGCPVSFTVWIPLVFVVLCHPFGLKTARDRRWWASCAVFLICANGAILGTPHSQGSWVLAGVASVAATACTRLRWHDMLRG